MNTFLPYADIYKSAEVLDNKRLGKQRVETLQILLMLHEGGRWENHPAVKMWRGHVNALVLYGMAICDEWTNRGYSDSCKERIEAYYHVGQSDEFPAWFGLKCFHESHRSNLKSKDPKYYAKFTEEPGLPYCWPSGNKLRFKIRLEPRYISSMERPISDEITGENWDWSFNGDRKTKTT